jgi:hypothetical protein
LQLSTAERTVLLSQQRKLRLLERQRALRRSIESGQERICALPERVYKNIQASMRKYLVNLDKNAQEKHNKLWAERLAAIKQARSDISVKVRRPLLCQTRRHSLLPCCRK